jgi:uncharacterized protein with von Willebrand factor type A (vWA) domain
MYDAGTLNLAQDIVIDNYIKTKIKDWRDLREVVNKVNSKISEKNLPYRKIKLASSQEKIDGDSVEVLKLVDTDLYVYLTETMMEDEIKQMYEDNRLDQHGWTAGWRRVPVPSPGEGEKKEEKENKEKDEAESFYNEIINKLKERAEKICKDGLLAGDKDLTLEEVYMKIEETRQYDLFNILRRYVKKMSVKIKQRSWRKVYKRRPFINPGNIYKREPGEIFLVVDISGSMYDFLVNYLPKVYSDIYSAFERIARIYTPRFKTYVAQVGTKIRKLDVIKNVKDLEKIEFKSGWGTDYWEVFEYLRNWRHNTQSSNLLPDLIIFVSDFETSSIKEFEKKYPELANRIGKRLLWLYTGEDENLEFKPNFGEIIHAFSFFRLNERG